MSWRPMLRLAWRTALRSKGRTALVAVLVGLPVFAGVLVDVFVRATSTPPATYARWEIGSADAKLEITPFDRIVVNGLRNGHELLASPAERAAERDPRRVDAAALLPDGSRLLAAPSSATLSVRSGPLLADTVARRLAGADPMTEGMTRLRSGRFPTAADEVAVTTSLGQRLGLLESGDRLRTNAAVEAGSGASARTNVRVVGVVDLPGRLNAQLLIAPPETSLLPSPASGRTYLVDLPTLTSEQLHALADRLAVSGVLLTPRDAYVNPQNWVPGLQSQPLDIGDVQALALGVLCIGFGLLEIVLLAGAAFAVGARRQTRELGLLAATGGSHKEIRRVVLAQGLVLGLIGAFSGAFLAVGLPVLAKPLVERLVNHEIDPWPFAPLDYAVLIAIGTLSGLAAAVAPAIGAARMAPIAALSGRFKGLTGLAKPPKLAVGLLAAGLAAGVTGSVLLGGGFAEYERELELQRRSGMSFGGMFDNLTAPVGLCLLGFTLTAFGLVRLMPAVISWIAALGGRLPLSIRLAFRDGSRHRHRTGPAAAAVMVVVAGSVGGAFLLAGSEATARASYVPMVPVGAGLVSLPNDSPDKVEKLRSTAESVLTDLPAERIWQLDVAMVAVGDRRREREVRAVTPDLALGGGAYGSNEGPVFVARPDFLDTLTDVPERERAAAKQALRDGSSVVLNPTYVRKDGTVWISHSPSERFTGADLPEQTDEPQHKLAAHHLPTTEFYTVVPPVIVSEQTASRLGWQTRPLGLMVEGRDPITQRTEDLVNGRLSGSALRFAVERGFQPLNPLVPLAAVAFAGVITLAGVAISVALSASEGRADLATLAAVGAPPRRRRSLAAAQALLVSGLGCGLGIGLGCLLAFAAQAAMGAPEFVVPWSNLLTTAVVIPLFAALCAALFTRSSLPMVRRAE